MNTKSLFFALLLIAAPVFGQEQPRVVEPIRVALSVQAKDMDGEALDGAVRGELNKLKDVAIAARRFDYELYVVAVPLTDEGYTFGYAASALIVSGPKPDQFKLLIHTGRSVETLARELVQIVYAEVTEERRRRKEEGR